MILMVARLIEFYYNLWTKITCLLQLESATHIVTSILHWRKLMFFVSCLHFTLIQPIQHIFHFRNWPILRSFTIFLNSFPLLNGSQPFLPLLTLDFFLFYQNKSFLNIQLKARSRVMISKRVRVSVID